MAKKTASLQQGSRVRVNDGDHYHHGLEGTVLEVIEGDGERQGPDNAGVMFATIQFPDEHGQAMYRFEQLEAI